MHKPTFDSAAVAGLPIPLFVPAGGSTVSLEFQALPAIEWHFFTLCCVALEISLRVVAQFTKQQSLLDFQIKHLKEMIFAECAIVVNLESTR